MSSVNDGLANEPFDADFSQLLDLPDVAFGEDNAPITDITSPSQFQPPVCPSHTGDDCLCHGFMGDWNVPVASTDFSLGLEEPDYTKFENWIPRYITPEKPCDYCRSKRLVCYLQRGEARCTPCSTLFRECSLTNSHTLEASNYLDNSTGLLLDTLHVVDENACQEQGSLTGVKPLISKTGRANGTTSPVRSDDAPGSSKRNGIRFARHAVKILREWLDAHGDHPYPTEEEKAELEEATDLKPVQIANWLANARRRRKVTERARPKLCMSPSLRPSTPAIDIPSVCDKPWDELNPLERWKHSPPENEPASITDIASAVARSDLPDGQPESPSSSHRRLQRSSNGSGFSKSRPASTVTSLETSGQSSSRSASSAAFSHNSSHSRGSYNSFSSSLAGKRERRRSKRSPPTAARKNSDDKKRMFQCTFCTDTFKSKYDWTRHEKSLHLSLEKWVCAPFGAVYRDHVTDNTTCVFCGLENPSPSHAETHNFRQCEEKGLDARTFYRKDHLRQHLRLMHGCELTPFMDGWKSMAGEVNSRCGFCAKRFTIWQERVDHLTAHFKAGMKMASWRGCRGLDPAVAAQVTNAMPPYLIGIESVSPNPFSATNRSTWRQYDRNELEIAKHGVTTDTSLMTYPKEGEDLFGSPRITCWEALTVFLGKYASEMARQNVVLTDDMLQRQARIFIFGSDDSWNQTVADNPEWLDLFKKAHGLDYIPTEVGGQGLQIPEDLETYGDLGLRIPFAVQLQAYNSKLNDDEQEVRPKVIPDVLEQTREEFRNILAQLSDAELLYDETFDCGHEKCRENLIDLNFIERNSGSFVRRKRWCTHVIKADKLQMLKEAIAKGEMWRDLCTKGASLQPTAEVANARRTGELPELSNNFNLNAVEGCGVLGDGHECVVQSSTMQNRPSFRPVEDSGDAVQNRNKGLAALAHAEAPLTANTFHAPVPSRKKYLPRHRYELPRNRAQRFATTTRAWDEAGMMPEPFETSPPTIEQQNNISTGAIMEFLGGGLGQALPFCHDASTSQIPLLTTTGAASSAQNFAWSDATGLAGLESEDAEALAQDLDRFVAATTAAEQARSQTAYSAPYDVVALPASEDWMAGNTALAPDVLTDFAALDAMDLGDMTFDGVFDMTMDDDGLGEGSRWAS